jgi:hypothetical protein
LLDDGGFATVLVSWVPHDAEPEPLAWAPDDCSALVLRLHEETPRAAAEYWHADRPPVEARAGVERWLDYYRRERIDSIAYGAVVVERAPSGRWRDWVDLQGGPSSAAGAQLERIFTAHEGPPPPRHAWAPDVHVSHDDGTVTVSVQPGLGISVELSEQMLDAVESDLTDDTTVQQVVRDLHSLGFLVARP